MQSPFYSHAELLDLGVAAVGNNVRVSRMARIHSPQTLTIGDSSRIDDFCLITGTVTIGRYVHISAFAALYGKHGITIGDFAGISARCTVYSESDDFSGDGLVGPFFEASERSVVSGPVVLGRFVQIGAHSIVMPDCKIGDGAAVGSLSMVKSDLEPWMIHAGIPARPIRPRSRKLLTLSSRYESTAAPHD